MSADSPSVRYPKRKRQAISYSEPADDEDLNLESVPEKESTPRKGKTASGGEPHDADPSDDDFELGQRKRKKVW